MIVTKQIMEQGKSSNGGYNSQQIKMLGEDIKKSGWFKRCIGKCVSDENIRLFLELKDAHFKGGVNKLQRKLANKSLLRLPEFLPVPPGLPWPDQYLHPNWQRMRLFVLQRDFYKCVGCGDPNKQLHAHHIRYIKGVYIWDVPHYYIVTLCEDCHSAEHRRDLRVKPTNHQL